MGPVERRVRRQARLWVRGNPASEAMARSAVTIARGIDEGRPNVWLPVVLLHLRYCGNPPDSLDEIRARGCVRWADLTMVEEERCATAAARSHLDVPGSQSGAVVDRASPVRSPVDTGNC
jgi:hypothetical protein